MEAGQEPAAQPLTYRAIVLGAVIVLGIGATALIVPLWRYGSTVLRTPCGLDRRHDAISAVQDGWSGRAGL